MVAKKPDDPRKETGDLLVDRIYTQLECKEEQTKTIIKQFLSDIQLFDRKQGDYGPLNISKFGVIGVLIRSSDKIERLINLHGSSTIGDSNLSKKVRNLDENIGDTWADLSVYGAIARTINEGKWDNV